MSLLKIKEHLSSVKKLTPNDSDKIQQNFFWLVASLDTMIEAYEHLDNQMCTLESAQVTRDYAINARAGASEILSSDE
jgi:hypothetical protein